MAMATISLLGLGVAVSSACTADGGNRWYPDPAPCCDGLSECTEADPWSCGQSRTMCRDQTTCCTVDGSVSQWTVDGTTTPLSVGCCDGLIEVVEASPQGLASC
eukprot:2437771-Prymnesium_polylepis.1